jgi:hypothetical protein
VSISPNLRVTGNQDGESVVFQIWFITKHFQLGQAIGRLEMCEYCTANGNSLSHLNPEALE